MDTGSPRPVRGEPSPSGHRARCRPDGAAVLANPGPAADGSCRAMARTLRGRPQARDSGGVRDSCGRRRRRNGARAPDRPRGAHGRARLHDSPQSARTRNRDFSAAALERLGIRRVRTGSTQAPHQREKPTVETGRVEVCLQDGRRPAVSTSEAGGPDRLRDLVSPRDRSRATPRAHRTTKRVKDAAAAPRPRRRKPARSPRRCQRDPRSPCDHGSRIRQRSVRRRSDGFRPLERLEALAILLRCDLAARVALGEDRPCRVGDTRCAPARPHDGNDRRDRNRPCQWSPGPTVAVVPAPVAVPHTPRAELPDACGDEGHSEATEGPQACP